MPKKHKILTLTVACRLPKEYAKKLIETFTNGGGYQSLSEFFREAIREKAAREVPQIFVPKNWSRQKLKNLELTNIKDLEEEVKA